MGHSITKEYMMELTKQDKAVNIKGYIGKSGPSVRGLEDELPPLYYDGPRYKVVSTDLLWKGSLENLPNQLRNNPETCNVISGDRYDIMMNITIKLKGQQTIKVETKGRVELGRIQVKMRTEIDRNGYARDYSSEYYSRTSGKEYSDSWDRVRWG